MSAPMVRAILEGRKTQTRRKCMARTQDQAYILAGAIEADMRGCDDGNCERAAWKELRNPYGQPGDHLWVRETWAPLCGPGPQTIYRADGGDAEKAITEVKGWKPSIHMHRFRSRITLEITGVRVERLQDINRFDAIAEGYPHTKEMIRSADPWHPNEPIAWYADLWNSINGAGSWEANPFCWVIEFNRIKP